jgi:hypothetical protein
VVVTAATPADSGASLIVPVPIVPPGGVPGLDQAGTPAPMRTDHTLLSTLDSTVTPTPNGSGGRCRGGGNDLWEPVRLIDSDGELVVAVMAFLRELQASAVRPRRSDLMRWTC